MKRDYYEILGITKNASISEIKKAFRFRAKQLHPDHGGDATAFAELKDAFEQAILLTAKAAQTPSHQPAPAYRTGYDPFTDPDYENYIFFEPHEDRFADFERHVYAGNCPYCGGRGKISKLVHPEKGFLGREERFCICQKVGEIVN